MILNLKNRSLHCGFMGMILCSLVLLISCSKAKEQDKSVTQELRWGTGSVVLMAPVWIAKEKRFFEEFGVVPEWKSYDSGLEAVTALSNGDVQIANCADFVAARYIMTDPSVRIICSIAKGESERVVTRRNRAIHELSDLKGKKVGLLVGSSSDFFLHFALKLQGIPAESVEIVNIAPAQQIEALMKGEVDAMAVWEPWVTQAMGRLGEDGVTFPLADDLTYSWLLMSKKEFIDKNPSVVEQILKALLKAEEYLNTHGREADNLLKKYVGEATLENRRFLLNLDRSLLIVLEAQARWLSQTQPQEYPVVPNFLNFMYFSGLEQAKPERVRLSH
jgi:NitT/TauT family transport system substrate-binding protein